jgi:alkanesulfonate monooxygenase SsuD/methylene tetrahydromethanopterin reductase-like flavin-dependent oxidoreductase (luciferase family)
MACAPWLATTNLRALAERPAHHEGAQAVRPYEQRARAITAKEGRMTRHPWVAAGDQGVRFGVQLITSHEPDALPRLLETGKRVEELGYDGLFIFDHPMIHVDPWIALSALATVTSRVRLGSVVNCVWYRHPAHLARLAADLDNLSGGRLMLGLGSGWHEGEFASLGASIPPIPERQAGLDEAVAIIKGVWGDKPFSYEGKHFRTEETHIQPPPRQQPPPIMIGGSGERVTLRQVAQHADACNINESMPYDPAISLADRAAAVKQKFEALRQHCANLGRPEDEVLRTHFTVNFQLAPTAEAAARKLDAYETGKSTSPGTRRVGKQGVLSGSPEQLVEYYGRMKEAGAQYFVVQLEGADLETIELLATEVMPHVR